MKFPMKVKNCLRILIVSAAFFTAIPALAQKTNGGIADRAAADTNRVVVNGFLSNWFVAAGAGQNWAYQSVGTGMLPAFALDLTVGKWFSPDFGFRIGWQGTNIAQFGKRPLPNVHSYFEENKNSYKEKSVYNYLHADLLWNASQTLEGFRQDRFWNFIPYIQGGLISVSGDAGNKGTIKRTYGAGVGLINTFRINDRINLFFDIRGTLAGSGAYMDKNKGKLLVASGTAGLSYNIGDYNWNRMRDIGSRANDPILNGLWDNWFISFSGGISSPTYSIAERDWKCKTTPAFDLSIGKWASPDFGARFGWQGARMKSKAVKDGFAYFHGDVLWNVTNTAFGYKKKRVYNFIPYIHGGLEDLYKPGQNLILDRKCLSFQAGAGILNNFRISQTITAFVDLRSFLLTGNGTLSNYGKAVMLSGLTGLTYNIGRSTWEKASFHRQHYIERTESKIQRTRPYLNDFSSNWFVSMGGGVDVTYQPSYSKGIDLKGTSALDFNFGKWFSPEFGLRAGLQTLDYEEYCIWYAHSDLLWNLNNTFGRYRSDRFWNLSPYIHGGIVDIVKTAEDKSSHYGYNFTAGGGILNNFRLTDNLGLYLDTKAALLSGKSAMHKPHGKSIFASASIGIVYNIGRSVWSFEKDTRNKKVIDGKFFDNWFVSGAAGIYSGTDSGTHGAFDLAIGKWLSPDFGFRTGLEGTRVSAEGKKDADRLYLHGDVMWNVINSFSNYNSKRNYNITPYIHGGIYEINHAGSLPYKNRIDMSFAAGAGIINSYRIADAASVFLDVKSVAVLGESRLNPKSGNGIDITAMLGLSYDLGYGFDYGKSSGDVYHRNRDEKYKVAISTNIVDWAAYQTFNVEAQYALSKHISSDIETSYQDGKLALELGAKYWPWYTYSGVWFKSTLKCKDALTSNETSSKGLSLGLGYSYMLCKWMNLDFGYSFWGGYKTEPFIGTDTISASLMFMF